MGCCWMLEVMTGVEGGERMLERGASACLVWSAPWFTFAGEVISRLLVDSIFGLASQTSTPSASSTMLSRVSASTPDDATGGGGTAAVAAAAAAADSAPGPAVAAALSNSNALRSNKSESKSNLIESKSQKISFSTKRFSMFIFPFVSSTCGRLRENLFE